MSAPRFNAPQLLLLSGEEVHVDVSKAAVVTQLIALVAEALQAFIPCLSLLHEGAVLPNTMPVEDISTTSPILVLKNAEVLDLYAQLQALDVEIKSLAAECDLQRQQTAQYRQEFGQLGYFSVEDIDEAVARAELDLNINTHSLRYEQWAVAHIRALKQKRPLVSKLRGSAERARNNLSLCRSQCIEAKIKGGDLLEKGNGLIKSDEWGELVGCYCRPSCSSRLNQCGLCYDDFEYYDYVDCYCEFCVGKNPDEYQHEDHARRSRRVSAAPKKARDPVARLRQSDKVRPRGGRHKAGEKVDLKIEVQL